MADGITLPQVANLGNGVSIYMGTFIHTAGAAECTFTIGNARVYALFVTNQDTSGVFSTRLTRDFTESVSGGTNTVTVHELGTIADGRIVVIAKA